MDMFADDWLYVTGYETWYKWTGTHWKKDDSREMREQLQTLMGNMNSKASILLQGAIARLAGSAPNDSGKSEINQLRSYVSATKRTNARLVSVETMARDKRATAAGDLDVSDVLNLRNGTLDLSTIGLLSKLV